MSIYRIRFSNIKNKYLRRLAMLSAAPIMVVCNLGFVVIAIVCAAPGLFFRAAIKNFDGFSRVWGGDRVDNSETNQGKLISPSEIIGAVRVGSHSVQIILREDIDTTVTVEQIYAYMEANKKGNPQWVR